MKVMWQLWAGLSCMHAALLLVQPKTADAGFRWFTPCCPGVMCWAFSPPGGLMSVPLAEAVADFTISCVCGKDVVPRTSVANIGRLLDDMVKLCGVGVVHHALTCCIYCWTYPFGVHRGGGCCCLTPALRP